MSAATTAPPAVVRTTSRRPNSYQRTPSSSSRTPATLIEPHRSDSSSQRGPAMAQQQGLGDVARRDYEQSNLARPQSTRRSSSKDRNYTTPSSQRTDGAHSSSHRSNSRHGQTRYSSDVARPPPSTGHATPQQAQSRSRGDGTGREAVPVKKRTTVTAQTGIWTLGKTIGAGSMGKVKLARNTETGEQVCSLQQ